MQAHAALQLASIAANEFNFGPGIAAMFMANTCTKNESYLAKDTSLLIPVVQSLEGLSKQAKVYNVAKLWGKDVLYESCRQCIGARCYDAFQHWVGLNLQYTTSGSGLLRVADGTLQ